jgi:hypothetical protein
LNKPAKSLTAQHSLFAAEQSLDRTDDALLEPIVATAGVWALPT